MSEEDAPPESEINTDALESNVILAFGVMKEMLIRSGNKHKPQLRRQYLRKKIYETFCSNEKVSPLTDIETETVEKDQAGKSQEQTNFFIDRESRSGDGNNTNNNNIEVETIDLSDMTQSTTAVDNKSSIRDSSEKKTEKKKKKREDLSTQLNSKVSAEDVYIIVDPGAHKPVKKNELVHKEPEIMKKSVITDEYEKQDSIQTVHTSHRQRKKERKLEREKTKGEKWYHMPAMELTEEQKNDLQVLQMRKALDPKRFYKANDMSGPPKFVQFGKVVESAADFYDSRIPKKQRKATIVEELLADTEFRKYNKRKYEEIQEARRMGKGPYKHMKRLKKHKK